MMEIGFEIALAENAKVDCNKHPLQCHVHAALGPTLAHAANNKEYHEN